MSTEAAPIAFKHQADADHVECWFEDSTLKMFLLLTDASSRYSDGIGKKFTKTEFIVLDGVFYYNDWADLVGVHGLTFGVFTQGEDLIVNFHRLTTSNAEELIGQYKGKKPDVKDAIDIAGTCTWSAWDGVTELKQKGKSR